ncbi:MAG: tetratricopeptide repeat protein [Caldimonas sp.]
MTRSDARGCAVSGATPSALEAYERILADHLAWRGGAEARLVRLLAEAPSFVMAHVLQAGMLACSRDPRRVRSAVDVLQRAAALPANERERMHLGAIQAVVDDDYELGKRRFGDILAREPRDLQALQVSHSFDYVTGDVAAMNARVAGVLPAWSRGMPGYSAVRAIQAFARVENGDYDGAREAAEAALAIDPRDARAHHAMAHVFEMTERAAEGLRWMGARVANWGRDTVVATHCWWHVALFQLAVGKADRALALYDQRVRSAGSQAVADLIDASALLWRLKLAGVPLGPRWSELAVAWAPHVDDRFCSFNDLHAMLAFVGGQDWDQAQQLEQALAAHQSEPTRHGATTREIGLPACRALMAHGQGRDTLAITLFASLPAIAHRFGGSHAQRDVLHLTLLDAIARIRRPVQVPRTPPAPLLSVA